MNTMEINRGIMNMIVVNILSQSHPQGSPANEHYGAPLRKPWGMGNTSQPWKGFSIFWWYVLILLDTLSPPTFSCCDRTKRKNVQSIIFKQEFTWTGQNPNPFLVHVFQSPLVPFTLEILNLVSILTSLLTRWPEARKQSLQSDRRSLIAWRDYSWQSWTGPPMRSS